MDDRPNNSDFKDDLNMNGKHESSKHPEEAKVFAELFALDQQPDPAPGFVARLSESLMPSVGKIKLLNTTTSDAELDSPLQSVPSAAGGGKRSIPFISFGSAAVLMVIVVLVGYLVTLWAVDDKGNSPNSMAFASTFVASETAVADACYVEPRNLNDVVILLSWALYGVPNVQDFETPPATAITISEAPPEEGNAASEEITDRVWEVFQQYMDCWAIGDELRMYALFTDDGVARTLAPDGVANFYRITALARSPHPDLVSFAPWRLGRVEIMSDGRAVLYLRDFSEETLSNRNSYVIFKEVGGHWLIEQTHLPQG